MERIGEDVRSDRWGHIALANPVPHPDAPDVGLRYVPVMPPVYRRFRNMSAEETHSRARSERDWVMSNADSLYTTYGDLPDTLLLEQGLWNQVHGRPLSDTEIEELPPMHIEPTVGGFYRRVIVRSQRTGRLTELGAPDEVVDSEWTSLVEAVHQLFAQLQGMDLPEDVRRRARAMCALERDR